MNSKFEKQIGFSHCNIRRKLLECILFEKPGSIDVPILALILYERYRGPNFFDPGIRVQINIDDWIFRRMLGWWRGWWNSFFGPGGKKKYLLLSLECLAEWALDHRTIMIMKEYRGKFIDRFHFYSRSFVSGEIHLSLLNFFVRRKTQI